MENDNIIKFEPRDEAKPLVTRKPKDYQGCQHNYFVVDAELRTVECAKCETILDPIQVLIFLCKEYEMRDYKYQKIQEFEAKEKAKRDKRDTMRVANR